MSKQDNNFNYKDGITLKDYINEKCTLHMREINERILAFDKAMQIARELTDKRLDSMNEFRGALKDAQSGFMSKVEYEAKHQVLQNQVDDLRLFKSAIDAKANQSALNLTFFISIIGLLLAVISLFYK